MPFSTQRAEKLSRSELRQLEERQDGAIRKKQEEDLMFAIHKENPRLMSELDKAEKEMRHCQSVLGESYLGKFTRIFSEMMMWPFVVGIEASEAVTAGARLILFATTCFLLAVFASKNTSGRLAEYLEIFNMRTDKVGLVQIFFIFLRYIAILVPIYLRKNNIFIYELHHLFGGQK